MPFHWKEGANSESARREAGANLYDKLRGYDREGRDYYLIGHSHGGSVIYNALLESVAKGKPLERLKSWCTVGTPFLDYHPNRFLFARVSMFGKTLYMIAVAALLFAVILAAFPLIYGERGFLLEFLIGSYGSQRFIAFTAAYVFYAATALLVLFIVDRYGGGWRTKNQKEKVRDLYEGSWLGLWHRDDEALSALANVKALKGPIIPSTFLVPSASILPLFFIIPLIFIFLRNPLSATKLPHWMLPEYFISPGKKRPKA